MKLTKIVAASQTQPKNVTPKRVARQYANSTAGNSPIIGMELSVDIANCSNKYINGVNSTICDQLPGSRSGMRIISNGTKVNFPQAVEDNIAQINTYPSQEEIPISTIIPPEIQFLTNNSNMPTNFQLISTTHCGTNGTLASLRYYSNYADWSDFVQNGPQYRDFADYVFPDITCDSGVSTPSAVPSAVPTFTQPAAAPTSSSISSSGNNVLSTGSIIGIASGVVAAVTVVTLGALFLYHKTLQAPGAPSSQSAQEHVEGVELRDVAV